MDIAQLFHGNPWPLAKTGASFLTIKGLAKLMTDEKFLKMVEDAILASDTNNIPKLVQIFERMKAPIMAAISEDKNSDQEPDL